MLYNLFNSLIVQISLKENEIKFINRCNSISNTSTEAGIKNLFTFDDIQPYFQTMSLMQYLGQEAALRKGDFQIDAINKALLVIKRYKIWF